MPGPLVAPHSSSVGHYGLSLTPPFAIERVAFSVLHVLVTFLCPGLLRVYVTSHESTGCDVVNVIVSLVTVTGDVVALTAIGPES